MHKLSLIIKLNDKTRILQIPMNQQKLRDHKCYFLDESFRFENFCNLNNCHFKTNRIFDVLK